MHKLYSPAKINLFLEVIGKEDGLHKLHSLFIRINLCDEITIKPSNELSIQYENQSVDGDIIGKAVNVMLEHFPNINTQFAISIRKNIPIGSGLGGASSNAAEIIKFLIGKNNLFVEQGRLLAIGKKIGADVPFFLKQGSQILTGTSLELEPISFELPRLFGIIAFPSCTLLTKDVFARISPPYTILHPVKSFTEATLRINEMQFAANSITNGLISKTLDVISHNHAIATRMSGSGCGCFSLFESESTAKEFYRNLEGKHGATKFFFVEPI